MDNEARLKEELREAILRAATLSKKYKIEQVADIYTNLQDSRDRLAELDEEVEGLNILLSNAENPDRQAALEERLNHTQETKRYVSSSATNVINYLYLWENILAQLPEELAKEKYGSISLDQAIEESQDEEGEIIKGSVLQEAANAILSARVRRPSKIDYPIDKINWNVWNLLEKDTKGQITFSAEKKGSEEELDILYSIDFGSLDSDGINITKRLTPFDKRVYLATGALYRAGNSVITLTQIHRVMGNTGRPSAKQLERIHKSVYKMMSAQITVDNSSEAKIYTKYGQFVYRGALLQVEFLEHYNIQGSLTEAAIHIFREPPLITFARQRKQLTTIPLKLLQSPLSKTDEHLAIDDYLIERIERTRYNFKNGHLKKGDLKITYKSICEHANITGKQKQRLPETVKRYMEFYKECNRISSFKEEADGVSYQLPKDVN